MKWPHHHTHPSCLGSSARTFRSFLIDLSPSTHCYGTPGNHGRRAGTTTLCRNWLYPPVWDLWIRLQIQTPQTLQIRTKARVLALDRRPSQLGLKKRGEVCDLYHKGCSDVRTEPYNRGVLVLKNIIKLTHSRQGPVLFSTYAVSLVINE